jgi:hydroxylysine kinase
MLEKIAVPVAEFDVLAQLRQHYNLDGHLQAITGERDYNYSLTCSNNTRYIVKVAHEDEDFETLDFQSQVIAQITRNAPHVPVSTEMANQKGEPFTTVYFKNGPRRFLRVNRFMPGIPLCDVERTTETRKAIGALTASLATALTGFHHPAATRVLLWDIHQAAGLMAHMRYLPPEHLRLVEGFHKHFLNEIAPLAAQLRQGVIHNDLNLHNIFVDANDHSRITGCIDFGDMVRAPLVNDLAVSTAYQLDLQRPLASILEVAQSYHDLRQLLPLEVDHLFHLVAMRYVLTVTITHWRSKLHPENAVYILRNAAAALAGLEVLRDISPALAREFLYDHLKPEEKTAQ